MPLRGRTASPPVPWALCESMNIESTVKATLIAPWASLLVVVFAFGSYLLEIEPDHFQQMLSQIPGLLFVLAMFVFGILGTSYI